VRVVGDGDAEGLLDGHLELGDVQAVEAEVLLEVGVERDFGSVQVDLVTGQSYAAID
jgi:hypothetical protein